MTGLDASPAVASSEPGPDARPGSQPREVLRFEELLIGGNWREPAGGELLEVRFPHDLSLVALVAEAGETDVDEAVRAARRAFDEGPWPRMSPAERHEVVADLVAAYVERADELGRLVTLENGGPIAAAMSKQNHAIERAHNYLQAAQNLDWETEQHAEGARRTIVRREPVGVVAGIVPWNAPQILAIVKLIPALLAGCTVLLKPSPETAADGQILAQVLADSRLPEGVVSVLPAGRRVSEYLVAHPGVDKIAFTGSTATGKRIAAIAAQRLARVSLELGGKSAAILLDDVDVDRYAEGVVGTSMSNSGQVCASHTRILAPASRYDEAVAAAVGAIAALRVGNPLDPATRVGPVASKTQQQTVQRYIDLGIEEGARVALGGPGLPDGDDLTRGCYVKPTIFADVANSMRIAQEEIFGPVLVVIPYTTEPEAIAIANDSAYGLSGGVWTQDLEHGLAIGRQIRTGRFQVNGATPSLDAPFGGFKASGIGREYGPIGLAAYTEYKTLAV